jgi:hypothetical protein
MPHRDRGTTPQVDPQTRVGGVDSTKAVPSPRRPQRRTRRHLTITRGKSRDLRLVPLHLTITDALREYADQIAPTRRPSVGHASGKAAVASRQVGQTVARCRRATCTTRSARPPPGRGSEPNKSSPDPRPEAQLRGQHPAGLVSRRRRRCGLDASAVDLPRTYPSGQHLLVSGRGARTHGPRRGPSREQPTRNRRAAERRGQGVVTSLAPLPDPKANTVSTPQLS